MPARNLLFIRGVVHKSDGRYARVFNRISSFCDYLTLAVFYIKAGSSVVAVEGSIPEGWKRMFRRLEFVSFRDFRETSMYDAITDEAAGLAAEWHRKSEEMSGIKITKGIDVYRVLENDIGYYLYEKLEKLKISVNILQRIQPDAVYRGLSLYYDKIPEIVASVSGIGHIRRAVPGTPVFEAFLNLIVSAMLLIRVRVIQPKVISKDLLNKYNGKIMLVPIVNSVYENFEVLYKRTVGNCYFLKVLTDNNKAFADVSVFLNDYACNDPLAGFAGLPYYLRNRKRIATALTAMQYRGMAIGKAVHAARVLFFCAKMAELKGLIRTYDNLITALQPKTIVHPQDKYYVMGLLVETAIARSVKCVNIQLGLYEKRPFVSNLHVKKVIHQPDDGIRCEGRILSDAICVIGESTRNDLISCGVEESKIFVTGSPRFDMQVRGKNGVSGRSLIKNLGIRSNVKMVLFAGQYPTQEIDDIDEINEAIILSVIGMDDVFLMIKPHPNENPSKYRALIKKRRASNAWVVDNKYGMRDLLPASGIMVTRSSTSVLDAFLYDVPVLVVNFSRKPDYYDAVLKNAALGIYDPGMLKDAIHNLLFNDRLRLNVTSNARQYLSYALKIDGLSVERILDVLGVSEKKASVK